MNRESVIKQLLELSKSINWKCELCGKEDQSKLINHHVSYIPEEIIVICRKCHSEIHGKNKRDSEIMPELSKKDWKLIKRLLYYSDLSKIKERFSDTNNSLLDIFRDPKILEEIVEDWPTDEEIFKLMEEKPLL